MWFYDEFRPGRRAGASCFDVWFEPSAGVRLPFMALTLDDVLRIAHLARIEIDADAARDLHAKLEAIFALINELQSIDTDGIEPMSHAQDVTAPFRDDVVTEKDRHADYQRTAPAVEDGLYLVPRVIE